MLLRDPGLRQCKLDPLDAEAAAHAVGAEFGRD